MFTDLKGFTSRTSQSSREQLHKMLETHEQIIEPIFKQFDGTVVKTIGDAFMVTFTSPTDAVLCGIEIQKILGEHNSDLEPSERLEVRIAINSGEVTIKGSDVFGEAVNIAARLEGIADAGDIYFTESVYLSMNKSEIPTAEVGHKHFKGIPEEIKVYKVLHEGRKKGIIRKEKAVVREKTDWKTKAKKYLKYAVIAFLIMAFIGMCSENEQFKEQDKEQAREQIEIMAKDAVRAIEEGNEREARMIIDELHTINEKYNNEELNQGIERLEKFYFNKFG